MTLEYRLPDCPTFSQNPLVLIADISEALWLADHPEATDVDIIVPNYSNLVVE